MFSFIKWFGSFIQKVKKNKGLWFTTLTVVSLIGIFTSLYFVNFLVSNVAKKTYENQKNSYILEFKNKLSEQNQYTKSITSLLSKDSSIANLIFSDDENSTKKLTQKLHTLESALNEEFGDKINSIDLEHYKKRQKSVGIKISKDGAMFFSSTPMAKKKNSVINIELKKSMKILVDDYKKEHKDFAFFISENSINKIDREFRKKNYENFQDKFFIYTKNYNPNFLGAIKGVELPQKLDENGYIKGVRYFYIYQKVYDYEGELAGVALIGEEIKNSNSFVNLVKNLVNSVTLVALGLIISMILFLF
jgi:hypothetical protein